MFSTQVPCHLCDRRLGILVQERRQTCSSIFRPGLCHRSGDVANEGHVPLVLHVQLLHRGQWPMGPQIDHLEWSNAGFEQVRCILQLLLTTSGPRAVLLQFGERERAAGRDQRTTDIDVRVTNFVFLRWSLVQLHLQAEHRQFHEMSAYREGAGAKSADHRCRTRVRRATKWRWRPFWWSLWPFLSVFDEQLPQRPTGTDDGHDRGGGEQVKCVVKVWKTLPSQLASFDLFDCEDVGGMRPQSLVDAVGPLAGVPRHALRDLEHHVPAVQVLVISRCGLSFRQPLVEHVVQQVIFMPKIPPPTTIVSASDCCGAADGGRAERRAAESTNIVDVSRR